MSTEEALALLGIDWPRSNKLSCPKHSDSDPSLHLYPEDRGFYCFSCGEGGDALTLLSHFTGKPVGEIMSEHGITLGPRGRSRWQQVADIERRGDELAWGFHLSVKALLSPNHLAWISMVEERVEVLFEGLKVRMVKDELAPFELHALVRELDRFYQDELVRAGNYSLVTSDRGVQRPKLRPAILTDGGCQRSGPSRSVPWQGGTVRVGAAKRTHDTDGESHPSPT